MKKRLLAIGLLLGLTPLILLALNYVITVSLQPPLPQKELAALLSAPPLAYLECSHLQTRLKQFTDSPEYQAFRQSVFVKQVQQTEWWAEWSASLQQFWNGLILDPLRLIGADVALAVYPAEKGELLPGVILIGKIDRIVKIAERILSVVGSIHKQIGITFEETDQGFPIYQIAQPDMLCPLYYTIAGDLGMIATSLPLLQATLRAAIEPDTRPGQPSAFHKAIQALPEKRVVAGYLNLAGVAAELRQNSWLSSLELPLESVWQNGMDFPLMTIGLETPPDHVTLRLELFAEADILGQPAHHSKNQAHPAFLPAKIPANVPMIAALDQKKLTRFLQHWQELWPQWEWSRPVQMLTQTQAIFGGLVECQVSDTLAGTVYPLPDLACLLETQRPEQAQALLDAMVQNVLAQRLPAMAQQAFVKRSTEAYRNTTLSTVQFMFQEMLSYAVAENRLWPSPAYTVLATTGSGAKKQLDRLQAAPREPQPAVVTLPQDNVAFMGWLSNPGLAEWIRKASQTNTFGLLYPRQTYAQFYRNLPLLIRFFNTLPPILITGGAQETGLYLELGFRPHETYED